MQEVYYRVDGAIRRAFYRQASTLSARKSPLGNLSDLNMVKQGLMIL